MDSCSLWFISYRILCGCGYTGSGTTCGPMWDVECGIRDRD